MHKKILKFFFDLEISAFEWFRETFAFTESVYLSPGVDMLTNSVKVRIQLRKSFPSSF